MSQEIIPVLSASLEPPLIRGAEPLTAALLAGASVQSLVDQLTGPFVNEAALCGALYDTAVLAMLMNQRELGLGLQRDLLTRCRLFRFVAGSGAHAPLRVLAIAAPGDLQMNMPIEFIAAHLDVRLDLLFLVPGEALPAQLPEHDVAFCVISDSDPAALHRAAALLGSWPRPVLNDPGHFPKGGIDELTRDGIAAMFANSACLHAPATRSIAREELIAMIENPALSAAGLPKGGWPLLIRPHFSHAGAKLARLEDLPALAGYLATVPDAGFHLSHFIDYRDPDGFFRKMRVAIVQGQPLLCHVGVSEHWMIHYLNAGMEQSAAKRADEAAHMEDFSLGCALRHAAAFAEIHAALGRDYVVIDCAEGPDGRLVLFEVEMAAIVHLLDSVILFPYKPAQMRRVFDAFDAMLRQSARAIEPKPAAVAA